MVVLRSKVECSYSSSSYHFKVLYLTLRNYYTIRRDWQPKIYLSWTIWKKDITYFNSANFKSFKTRLGAKLYMKQIKIAST